MANIFGFETLLFEALSCQYDLDGTIYCLLTIKRDIFDQIPISYGEKLLELEDEQVNIDEVDDGRVYILFSLEKLRQFPIVFHIFDDESDMDRKIYVSSDVKENIIIRGLSSYVTNIVGHNYDETGKWYSLVAKCFIDCQTRSYVLFY